MIKSIYDLYNSKAIAIYWEQVQSNRIPYLGEALFPDRKKMGLKLEWIKGYNQLPVALMPSAFDTKPTLRDRIGVTEVQTKMPFFRESMRIGEEDRQQLLMLMELNNSSYVEQIITRIFDDTSNLVEGALVQSERMRMQLLVDGKISIKAPDDSGIVVNYEYNYDPNGTWAAKNTLTLTGTDKWSDTENSNPVEDILEAKSYMAKTYGIQVTRGILTTATWKLIMGSEAVKDDIAYNRIGVPIISDGDLQSYLLKKTGITFAIYDKIYKNEAGIEKQYYPDNYLTLLPSNSLGFTYYGTTPEEADLMSGNTDANVSIVNTGVAILTKKESLPVNVVTSVSEIVLPSFERMNDVYVMKVA